MGEVRAVSERIQNMFSDIAPRYDFLNRALSFRLDGLWRRQAVRRLKQCERVIDLCAGTLDLSLALLKEAPRTSITAVDFSQNMLDRGKAKLRSDQEEKISLQCADVTSLPYPDKYFDGAMVAYGLRNVTDNRLCLREARRVLISGSPFVILEFFKPTTSLSRLFAATYGRFVVPIMGGLLSGNRSAYRYLRDSVHNYYSVDEFVALMEQSGFKDIQWQQQLGGPSFLVSGVAA